MFIIVSKHYHREPRECPGDRVEASLLSDLLLLLSFALAVGGLWAMILAGLWPMMLLLWTFAVVALALSVIFHDRELAVHSD